MAVPEQDAPDRRLSADTQKGRTFLSIKIGALWRHEYQDKNSGDKQVFYSGEMEWPGVKSRITVRKNDKKGKEKAPDLILFCENEDQKKQGQQNQNGGRTHDDADDF
jgi:hypothetical protein